MSDDLGPWTRLIEEHRRNVLRVEAAQTAPPPSWGFALGLVVPWLVFAAAVLWREPGVVITAAVCFAMLVPVGLACLLVPKLQIVTVGLVLGMGSALFTASALYG